MADTWDSALKMLTKHIEFMASKLKRYEKQFKEYQQQIAALDDAHDAMTQERDALADFVHPIIMQMSGLSNGLPGEQVVVAEVSDEKIAEMLRLSE